MMRVLCAVNMPIRESVPTAPYTIMATTVRSHVRFVVRILNEQKQYFFQRVLK